MNAPTANSLPVFPRFVNKTERSLSRVFGVLSLVVSIALIVVGGGGVLFTLIFGGGGAGGLLGPVPIGLGLLLGVLGLFVTFINFKRAKAYVELMPQGIVLEGVHSRVVPWHEVVRIGPKRRLGKFDTVARLTLAGGHRRVLSAPACSGKAGRERFDREMATLQQWLVHYRGW